MEAKIVKRATISARVIRADGTVEDLGVIATAEPKRQGLVKRVIDKIIKKEK